MSHDALQNGGMLQRPIFASQGGKVTDDFDLNDLFADYLMTDIDDAINPLAYSMGAHHPGAVAATLTQQQQQIAMPQAAAASPSQSPPDLNVGGMLTPWHAFGAAPATSPDPSALRPIAVHEPAAKRFKVEDGHEAATAPATHHLGAGMPASSPAAPPPPSGTTSGSAISGRLGFSMVGGQVAVPQTPHPPPPQPPETTAAGKVSLPVGVGVRVGGTLPQASAPGIQLHHACWDAVTPGVPPQAVATAPGQYLMWGGMGGAASPGGGLVVGAVGAMTEQAIAERRQRNREHAKRSRVRKKFMLESLQEQVRGLQKQNEQLRMLIQKRIPQHAQKIIGECCSKNPLFCDDAEAEVAFTPDGEKKSATELLKSDFSLIECLTSGQQNFVLSDPRLPDNPIVYASEGFYELTGYTREQVLGRNCRFLQGPGTDQKAVDVIRTAIANGTECTTCLLNYKADGTPFWNQFFIAALRDQDNCIVNYVGVQCEVEPDAGATALEDKVNSVLPLQKKGEDDDEGKDD